MERVPALIFPQGSSTERDVMLDPTSRLGALLPAPMRPGLLAFSPCPPAVMAAWIALVPLPARCSAAALFGFPSFTPRALATASASRVRRETMKGGQMGPEHFFQSAVAMLHSR